MEEVLEQRVRALIWFLMTLLNPIVLILFWNGVLKSTGGSIGSWNQSDINSYYLMLMVISNILVVHIEENIALQDVQLGYLSGLLLKPFSYYWIKFFQEIPYRILEGVYGLVAVFFIMFVFKGLTFFHVNLISLLLVSTVLVCALFISYTFKVIIGLTSLWLTQVDGLQDTLFVLSLIFGGFIIPLDMFPIMLKNFIFITPFPWITYYPVVVLQGKIDTLQTVHIIAQQFMWLVGLYIVYKLIWREGAKKFTAVGQ